MKINLFRIKKAYICFVHGIKNGRGKYWSLRLSLWWFSSGFTFENE